MDTRKYRTYSKEFKLEALELLESSGKSVAALERELGITTGLLPKWKQRYKVDKSQHSLEPSDLVAAQAELRRVKRELAIVSQERDILKKPSPSSRKNRATVPVHERPYSRIFGRSDEPSVERVAQRLLCVA
jgi:transposase